MLFSALIALQLGAAPAPDAEPRLTPGNPMQGTLVRLELRPTGGDSLIAAYGDVAGEPLHFQVGDSGTVWAFAGVPLDAGDILSVPLILEWGGGDLTLDSVAIPVHRGDYRLEKLRVAPRYGGAPDPTLQARIARERKQAAEVSRRSHLTPRLWTEEWRLPRESRVTSTFGTGREFNGVVQSRHTGLDLAGADGEPVRAANRGVVRLIGDFYYAGNAVYVDHGAGLVTAYFHLSRTEVAEGDTVALGQVLGRVGATGRVTGPHLHWVVRYGGISVDPQSLIRLAGARRESSATGER